MITDKCGQNVTQDSIELLTGKRFSKTVEGNILYIKILYFVAGSMSIHNAGQLKIL